MLLERDHQLAVLNERLSAAENRTGSVVLIGGEAGAGKTSLVRTFVGPLGTQAVTGACDPLSTPAPLSPLRDFVEVSDGPNIELFSIVLDRFGRAAGPMVIVLEDLHWADQATLDFIRYVGRRIGETKLVLICTFRSDEVGAEHPLQTVLGQLARLPTTERVAVPMLSLEAVRTLTASTKLNPVELHSMTGGNAFFVTEVIAAGGSPPESLHDAVLARLGGLAADVRRVIETISISPRSLDMGRALALGNEAGSIDSAVETGVVFADDGHLHFRHELARSAVEQAIPPARRHELHRAMLGLLLDESNPDHARLAHHAIEAHAPDLISQYAPLAARDASARASTREAAALFSAALVHSTEFEPEDAAAIRMELGVALIELDKPAEALDHIESSLAYFEAAGAVLQRAAALRQSARAHAALGRPGEAMRCSRAAVELAEREEPSEQLVLALNSVAANAMLARQATEGLQLATRAAKLAEQLALSGPLRSVEHTRACLALVSGDTDRGIELLLKSIEDAAELGVGPQVMALVNLGSGAGEVRRYTIAIDALVDAEALGVAHDVDASVAYTRAWLARVAFEQGRWDDAAAYASLVEETVSNRDGYALLTARGVLGRVRVRRGDPGGAELLAETLAGFDGHDLQYRWSPVSGMAEHHWLRGDYESMAALLSGPFREALETESEWARGELGYWMWKAGRLETAPSRSAAPFAAQINRNPNRAAELWAQIGSPFEEALARSEGPPELAIEALGIFDVLGAKPMADLVRSRLREAGVDRVPRGPREATQAHPFGLTGRQAEVLSLVSEGLSNGEIAERLYVSKKTVEHHVSAVYAKLGVESRAQAIAAAR